MAVPTSLFCLSRLDCRGVLASNWLRGSPAGMALALPGMRWRVPGEAGRAKPLGAEYPSRSLGREWLPVPPTEPPPLAQRPETPAGIQCLEALGTRGYAWLDRACWGLSRASLRSPEHWSPRPGRRRAGASPLTTRVPSALGRALGGSDRLSPGMGAEGLGPRRCSALSRLLCSEPVGHSGVRLPLGPAPCAARGAHLPQRPPDCPGPFPSLQCHENSLPQNEHGHVRAVTSRCPRFLGARLPLQSSGWGVWREAGTGALTARGSVNGLKMFRAGSDKGPAAPCFW